ncbi:MAG: HAD-IA family hydrolase [Candidatus Heimdallarchaeota archaeon]|nr:HAD-IA family hydrolase [Candidatus Heimdallarchaeota archaeon]
MKQDYRGKSLPRTPEAILFDFDGTLIDMRPKWWAPVERAFERILGYVPEESIRENISVIFSKIPENQSKLFLLKIMYGVGRAGGLGRVQSLRFLLLARSEYEKSRHINVPFDGIDGMIKELISRGMKLGIVSSASRSELENALNELPFLKGIPFISRHDVEELKPNPIPIIRGLEMIDADPETTLYVGDFQTDVQAGKAAHTMTCAVMNLEREFARVRLEKFDPDLMLDNTIDLIDYI